MAAPDHKQEALQTPPLKHLRGAVVANAMTTSPSGILVGIWHACEASFPLGNSRETHEELLQLEAPNCSFLPGKTLLLD